MNMGIMGLFFFLSGLVHGIEIFHVAWGVLNSELENYVAEFALPEFQLALKVVNQADGVRFFTERKWWPGPFCSWLRC